MLLGSVSNYLIQKSSSPVMVSTIFCSLSPRCVSASLSFVTVFRDRSLDDHCVSRARCTDERFNLWTGRPASLRSPTLRSRRNHTRRRSTNPRNMPKGAMQRTRPSRSKRARPTPMTRSRSRLAPSSYASPSLCIAFSQATTLVVVLTSKVLPYLVCLDSSDRCFCVLFFFLHVYSSNSFAFTILASLAKTKNESPLSDGLILQRDGNTEGLSFQQESRQNECLFGRGNIVDRYLTAFEEQGIEKDRETQTAHYVNTRWVFSVGILVPA